MIVIEIHKKLRAGHGQTDLHVKLQANKGSITVIHGPSGAGKSTLLKIIAGLMQPEQGQVLIDGQAWLDTANDINLSPQKRKAGFVFQNYALFPNMTVRQHLEYACTDAQWIDQLLKIGALDGLADRRPDYLSGGQQQRLAILRAMANKPALLLMDEPFSALDQKTKAGLIADLKPVWDKLQTTVIIVSHYPQELADIATQQLYIES
ncbi:MAG: ATP-binding cassette domain-containing protein [Bacteroidota bacterium]